MIEHIKIGILIDIYGELLTKRQLEMLKDYYDEDLSLSEIGDKYNISRQAVKDNIDKGEAKLNGYEDILHIMENREKNNTNKEKILKILDGSSIDKDAIKKLLNNIE